MAIAKKTETLEIDLEVEQDKRIRALARLLDESFPPALGRLTVVWMFCRRHHTSHLAPELVIELMEHPGGAGALIAAKLATVRPDGQLVIAGVHKRLTRVIARHEASTAGGKNRAHRAPRVGGKFAVAQPGLPGLFEAPAGAQNRRPSPAGEPGAPGSTAGENSGSSKPHLSAVHQVTPAGEPGAPGVPAGGTSAHIIPDPDLSPDLSPDLDLAERVSANTPRICRTELPTRSTEIDPASGGQVASSPTAGLPPPDTSAAGEATCPPDEPDPGGPQIPIEAWAAADALRAAILAEQPTHQLRLREPWATQKLRRDWAHELRKLNAKDGRTWEAIGEALTWLFHVQGRGRYAFIVQSPETLREKWDRIHAQMLRVAAQATGPPRRGGAYRHDGTETYGDGEVET